MFVLIKYGVRTLEPNFSITAVAKCILKELPGECLVWDYEKPLDKAVDFITEANYPGRAARPLAISNIETRFHVQFSNLSLPGCPTSAPYTHSEQAVLSLCLLNPRGEGRQGGIFVCPFNLHLS